jgi:hypothetical protein
LRFFPPIKQWLHTNSSLKDCFLFRGSLEQSRFAQS